MKTPNSQSGIFNPRVLLALTLCSCAIALGMFSLNAQTSRSPLSFEERVAYREKIEKVYWAHRTWPKENPGPKPALAAVMPREKIAQRIGESLRYEAALEKFWSKLLSPDVIQAEMDRQAKQSQDPAALRELWAAVGNDPYLIAETLVRPELAERRVKEWYAMDRGMHAATRARAERELAAAVSGERSGGPQALDSLRAGTGEIDERDWTKKTGGVTAEPSTPTPFDARRPERLVLSAEEWQAATTRLPASGQPGRLEEDSDRFYIQLAKGFSAKTGDTADTVRVVTVSWPKQTFADWWCGVRGSVGSSEARTAAPRAAYTLAAPSSVASTNDTWNVPPSLAAPLPRYVHTAVWTGTEMIVWGGYVLYGQNAYPYLNGGSRYTPATDSWALTSWTGVPSGRYGHTAIWTGTEMIVWGGGGETESLNSGGRYNPGTDSWAPPMNLTGAPTRRLFHTAVWTGSEMIVWGGFDGTDGNTIGLNSGGRYNPRTDTWTSTGTLTAPAGRYSHTAVWTGSEMIVWGGVEKKVACLQGICVPLSTGGRYSPATDSWVATSSASAPPLREGHTAVWTGSEMIVWGSIDEGVSIDFQSAGARYTPETDRWQSINSTGAPSARRFQTAVWTGSEMIVWGGGSNVGSSFVPGTELNDGGRYSPATDSWVATNASAAPPGRIYHTAVWTGTEMIVWGGTAEVSISYGFAVRGDGGRYTPATDSWVPTSTGTAITARTFHTAVWTGSEMIVWGGVGGGSYLNSGGRYTPATDSWAPTDLITAPAARAYHTAAWTGSEMIVWGGVGTSSYLNDGGRYSPGTDSWAPTSAAAAPAGRIYFQSVWTGSEMIVWGGQDSSTLLTSGGRYEPATDRWAATNLAGAPRGRLDFTAVWTGSEMIVWGGLGDAGGGTGVPLNDGARYQPDTDSWLGISSGPAARYDHVAVWTGKEMIVAGGLTVIGGNSRTLITAGRYNPGTDQWAEANFGISIGPSGFPSTYYLQSSAVWTGSEMIVWSGCGDANSGETGYPDVNFGLRYRPDSDTFVRTSRVSAPDGRCGHTTVWTGSKMIVWGGITEGTLLNSGGFYCAQTSTTTPIPTSVVSRKTHGAAGTFDVDLPLTGNPGIECRSGGATSDYTLVFTFASPLTTVDGASVATGVGSVSSNNIDGNDAHNYVVNLTGVTNAQVIKVSLTNVTDSIGAFNNAVSASMGVLIGDVNGSGRVDSGDVSLVRQQTLQPITSSSFREDINASGRIDSGDVSIARQQTLTSLP